MSSYRGRFAPSPTGDLHLGSARTALAAWLAARAAGGRLVLRMEDLDGPRVVRGAAERILEDLRRLGLDWDEGPDLDGGPHAPYTQSERAARYEAALEHLREGGRVFPCFCSRAEIARAAAASSSAPHGPSDDGPRYPGTCRGLSAARAAELAASGRRPAIRFAAPPGEVLFTDAIHGPLRYDVGDAIGDFVIRRADGLWAYQLAVVVDDAEMGVTDVVRGDDLLPSTARQILLYRALGFAPPRFAHVPLVLGPDGQRLSKRHGSIAIRALFERGVGPERVIALLLESLIGAPPGSIAPAPPRAFVDGFSLDRVAREPVRVDPARLLDG